MRHLALLQAKSGVKALPALLAGAKYRPVLPRQLIQPQLAQPAALVIIGVRNLTAVFIIRKPATRPQLGPKQQHQFNNSNAANVKPAKMADASKRLWAPWILYAMAASATHMAAVFN